MNLSIETKIDGYRLIIRLLESDEEGRETIISEDSVDVRDIIKAGQ